MCVCMTALGKVTYVIFIHPILDCVFVFGIRYYLFAGVIHVAVFIVFLLLWEFLSFLSSLPSVSRGKKQNPVTFSSAPLPPTAGCSSGQELQGAALKDSGRSR